MIDLEPKHLEMIKHILAQHVPDCEVRVFGSRVTGKAQTYSDIDIALVGNGLIDWRRIETLKDAFSESNLPIIVDVLDFNAASENFQKIIQQKYELIQAHSYSQS